MDEQSKLLRCAGVEQPRAALAIVVYALEMP